jgi:hypothetical protein
MPLKTESANSAHATIFLMIVLFVVVLITEGLPARSRMLAPM